VVVQPSIRLALLSGLAAVMICGAVGNARWLLTESYLRFSDQRAIAAETREAARRAAGIAQNLQPFSARALQAEASSDYFLNQPKLAIAEYESALLKAPADAYLWRDYALVLVHQGIFDARLERAVTQAQSWAVKSPPIHVSLAVVGLNVYQQSNAAMRALWFKSMRIAYPYQPDDIQWAAYVAEQELLLCDGGVVPHPETSNWCAGARWRHGQCTTVAPGPDSCFRKPERKP